MVMGVRNKPNQDSTKIMGGKPLSTESTNVNTVLVKMLSIADSTYQKFMPEMLSTVLNMVLMARSAKKCYLQKIAQMLPFYNAIY